MASGIPLRYSGYSARVVRSGVSLRGTGAPLPFCSYKTEGLVVVDRARGACPVTCSYRHLTSYLFRAFALSPLSRISRIWPLSDHRRTVHRGLGGARAPPVLKKIYFHRTLMPLTLVTLVYKHYSFPSPTGLCCLISFVWILGQSGYEPRILKTTRKTS